MKNVRAVADYFGYELGNFLLPKYPEWEGCDVFFLLLQHTIRENAQEKFSIKLGKTRWLSGDFYSDCLKVLVYLETGGGKYDIYDIDLKKKKDGTRFFDASPFLDNLGIEYEPVDTSHYRYFKSRLDEYRKELVIDDAEGSFSIIDRPINADDYESLRTFYNKAAIPKRLLRNGYFLIQFAKDRLIDYRSLLFFNNEQEMKEYIRFEFEGTSADSVTTFSTSDLLAGQTYDIDHRHGIHISQGHIILIHDSNLQKLYQFVDETDITDRDGNVVLFSDLLNKAKTADEIDRIVALFNDMQDNTW